MEQFSSHNGQKPQQQHLEGSGTSWLTRARSKVHRKKNAVQPEEPTPGYIRANDRAGLGGTYPAKGSSPEDTAYFAEDERTAEDEKPVVPPKDYHSRGTYPPRKDSLPLPVRHGEHARPLTPTPKDRLPVTEYSSSPELLAVRKYNLVDIPPQISTLVDVKRRRRISHSENRIISLNLLHILEADYEVSEMAQQTFRAQRFKKELGVELSDSDRGRTMDRIGVICIADVPIL